MEKEDNVDGLSPEELAAASGTGEESGDVQHQIDRGDFIDDDSVGGDDDDGGDDGAGAEGDGAGTGAGAGDGEGEDGKKKEGEETDLDALEDLAGLEDGEGAEEGGEQQVPSGMPYARANEISREKNAALDLASALMEGTIDKRWVADMGGQKAVVKGIAAGKIVLPRPEAGEGEDGGAGTVHPEIARLEGELDELNKQLAAATVDVNSEVMLTVQKKINTINREILKVENNLARQAETERARQEAAERDQANVQTVMVELWDKHPELHSDTNEYLAFMTRRDNHLRQGKAMSQALKLAAQETFPASSQDGGDGQDGGKKTAAQIAAERTKAARTKAAMAKAAQPPAGQAGAGTRATAGLKSIEKLSDDEFDKLTDEEKAENRGDRV